MTTHVGKGEAGGLKSTGLESHEKVVLSPAGSKLQVVLLWVTLQSTAVPLPALAISPLGVQTLLWTLQLYS